MLPAAAQTAQVIARDVLLIAGASLTTALTGSIANAGIELEPISKLISITLPAILPTVEIETLLSSQPLESKYIETIF
jgi:hypothetical protein